GYTIMKNMFQQWLKQKEELIRVTDHGATARCLLEGLISLDTFEMDNQMFIMKDLTNGLQR
ncbi:hypothetical protein HK096_000240, partial [Nowakowskiella sp. JEL0078]